MIARTRMLITVAWLCHLLLTPPLLTSQAQGVPITGRLQKGEPITISADLQEKSGDLYRLRGNAEIHFRSYILKADEITYDAASGNVNGEGHMVLDGGPHDEHLTASRGTYNLNTESGRFYDVVGTTGAKMSGRGVVLTSSNPFSFSGREVEKQGDKIIVHHGIVTACKLPQPDWSFHANEVVVVPGEDAKIYHTTFWLWRVPVFYLPFADHPVERLGRKTGFLLPSIGQSSRKGFVLGDSFYWAINRSMDLTAGAEYYSKRGWAQHGEFRARLSDTSSIQARYFGVLDRGLPTTQVIPGPNGTSITLPSQQDQGGEELRVNAESRFRYGLRAVADIDYLSSYLFRASFSESFAQAINSEVTSTAFVTENWHGYSFNLMSSRYQNFQTQNLQSGVSQVLITLVHAPSLQASSVDRQLGHSPAYWGFDAAAEGLSRREPNFVTANVVGRLDVQPRVSLPLFWNGWTLRPEVALRDTWYGDRAVPTAGALGEPSGLPVNRRAFESSVEFRPPTMGRIFDRTLLSHQLKHTIEPRVIYRYVNGIDNFHSIIRFDVRDVLSDTNEVEYGVINRLYAKRVGTPKECEAGTGASRSSGAEKENVEKKSGEVAASGAGKCAPAVGHEILSWEIAQKYFLDPTFGGALVNGVRNVFATTADFTGIAFATQPRRFSPIISRLRMRGPKTDIEWQLDYDTRLARINASNAFLNYRFHNDFSVGAAYFYLQTPGEVFVASTLPAPSQFNQFRVTTSYGHPNKRGINAAMTFGFDAAQGFLQYSAVQSSYNWDCCGITVEYRRFALGPLRNENQYRFALSLANVGTFGTLRKQERIY